MSNLDEFISAISGESYSSNSTSRAETAESVISSFVESLEDANTFEKIDALNRYKVQVNPYFPENTYAFNYIDSEIKNKKESYNKYMSSINEAKRMLKGYEIDPKTGETIQTKASLAYWTLMNGDRDQVYEALKYWKPDDVRILKNKFNEINFNISQYRDAYQNGGQFVDEKDDFTKKSFFDEWDDLQKQVEAMIYDASFYTKTDPYGVSEEQANSFLPLFINEDIPYLMEPDNDKWDQVRTKYIKMSENGYYKSEAQKNRLVADKLNIGLKLGNFLGGGDTGFITVDNLEKMVIDGDSLPQDTVINEDKIFDWVSSNIIGNTNLIPNQPSGDSEGDANLSSYKAFEKLGQALKDKDMETTVKYFNEYIKLLNEDDKYLDTQMERFNVISVKWGGTDLKKYADPKGHYENMPSSSNVDMPLSPEKLGRLDEIYMQSHAFEDSSDISLDSLKVGTEYNEEDFWSNTPSSNVANKTKDARVSNAVGLIKSKIDKIDLANPSYSDTIKDLQMFLSQNGYEIETDGYLGEETAELLNMFLRDNKMEPLNFKPPSVNLESFIKALEN